MTKEHFYIRFSLKEAFKEVSFKVFQEFRKEFLRDVTFSKESRLNLLSKYAKIA